MYFLQVADEYRKTDYKVWGNGRDWNFPSPREGGWVRIWPLTIEVPNAGNNSSNNGYVKGMVNKVSLIFTYPFVKILN